MRISSVLAVLVAITFAPAPSWSGIVDDSWAATDSSSLTILQKRFPESQGYWIWGDFAELAINGTTESINAVVCADIEEYRSVSTVLDMVGGLAEPDPEEDLQGLVRYPNEPLGIAIYSIGDQTFALTTVNGLRGYLWYAENAPRAKAMDTAMPGFLEEYAGKLDLYLDSIESGHFDARHPVPAEHELDSSLAFYVSSPSPTIRGRKNYNEYLDEHTEIRTDNIRGVTAFVPTAKTLARLKKKAPEELHSNKEAARLQDVYKQFIERGGDWSHFQTLTREGYDTLSRGEYLFVVDRYGAIRFCLQPLESELTRSERATGKKLPRVSHALLVHGQPVLTAGTFTVDEREEHKIVEVNAYSEQYFYSNLARTVKKDISEKSNEYLLTLGHFFRALERLDIPHKHILISKLLTE